MTPPPDDTGEIDLLDVLAEESPADLLADPGRLAMVLEQCLAAAQLEVAPHGRAGRTAQDDARDRRAADVVDLLAAALEVLGRDRLDPTVCTAVLQASVVALRQCARWCELGRDADPAVAACGRACRVAEQAVLDALVEAARAR